MAHRFWDVLNGMISSASYFDLERIVLSRQWHYAGVAAVLIWTVCPYQANTSCRLPLFIPEDLGFADYGLIKANLN